MSIDTILRPVIEHPKRGWIVITATFVVAVVFTWPAVDYYFAAAESRRALEAEVGEGTVTVGRLDLYDKQLERQKQKLATLEAQALTRESVEQFRDDITLWAKESGCQLRRVKLGDVQFRPWYQDDHPLEPRPQSNPDSKTPFNLRQQTLSLLVAGPMDRVSDFLARLSEEQKLLHTGSLQLRRSTEDAQAVEMELDLLLFDLVRGESKE